MKRRPASRYPLVTSVPPVPYSQQELHSFAMSNMQIYKNGEAQLDGLQEAAQYYASTLERLPPAFQIVVAAHHKATVMSDQADLDKRHEGGGALGLFVPGWVDGVGESPVFWGGMFESRPRTADGGVHPELTLRHEKGHRIDHILATRVAGTGQIPKDLHYFSTLPQWVEPALYELEREQRKGYFGTTPDATLYTGVKRLIEHLSHPRYQGSPATRQHHIAVESFAEMTVHYTTLYDVYNGDAERIDRKLSKAYPELWPVYRDEVLPRIEHEAVLLHNEMAEYKSTIASLEEDIARMHGDPFNAHEMEQYLRELELQGGIAELRRELSRAKELSHSYHQPITVLRNVTQRAEATRRDIHPDAPDPLTPTLRALLSEKPEPDFRILHARGINIIDEIELLDVEEELLPDFANTMRCMANGFLTSGHKDARWIIEDYDAIKNQFGRSDTSRTWLIRLTDIPHSLYERYSEAKQTEWRIMTPDIPHGQERAQSLRRAMYQEAINKTLEGTIASAEALKEAEERYCRAHMHGGKTLQDYQAYAREWESHAQTFAKLVRKDREHPTIKRYFAPDAHTQNERTWDGMVAKPDKNQSR